MSFASELLQELSSENAKLTELLQTKYADFDFILAVEGEDDVMFYHDYVDDYLPGETLIIPCGNKAGVISLKAAANSYAWAAKPNIKYVCDKDFDDVLDLKEPGVIYSDLYSIESYLTLGNFAVYIARKEGGVAFTAATRTEFLKCYEGEMAACGQNLKFVAAAMIEIRSTGAHPTFDKTSIADFFTMGCDGLTPKKVKVAELLGAWECEAAVDEERIKERAAALSDDSYRTWIRGKYLLQIAKKIFDRACQKVLGHTIAACSHYFGRGGMKYVKLAIPNLEFLKQGIVP